MAIKARPGKAAGGNAYVDGTTALAADVNADFDTIYNEFNGNIENANVKAAAGIVPTKIDDASVDDAAAITISDAGTTAAPVKATNLTEEIQKLRWMDKSSGVGVAAQYHNGTTTAVASALDGGIRGGSLVLNGSCQLQSGGAGTAPDSWTLAGTPSAITLEATPDEEGAALCVKAVSSGTSDGIIQTMTGIKKNALYVVGCRARAAVNPGFMGVSGGASSGAYQNTTIGISVSAAFDTYSLLVKADASGSDINLQISSGTTSLDEIYVYDVWMYEVTKNPVSCGTHPLQQVRTTTTTSYESTTGSGEWVALPDSSFDLSVTPERANLRVFYDAKLTLSIDSTILGFGIYNGAVRLLLNGSVVDGPKHVYLDYEPIGGNSFEIPLSHIEEAPAPGVALDFTIEIYDYQETFGAGSNIYLAYIINTDNLVNGGFTPFEFASSATLRVEEIS